MKVPHVLYGVLAGGIDKFSNPSLPPQTPYCTPPEKEFSGRKNRGWLLAEGVE